ncbi:hypothetical protein SAMN02745857_03495 [Andreprevotia lacus DSM 23236]|jgi:general secretion pathway protein I|uniref:General secretion pathway protein I n=1 Tax=Andreprevotia lacus DSM 23236 TaxID=1121001 RepID=A0A1W1XYE7_9NEIS|nr:hypothetical protein [Andreprevotia lacus]SMC28943.1 hypothetical protein SAMN02745857_03495 [Andreprevotia lacus DSM 23236]
MRVHRNGFVMLEVLVALVLVTSVGVAIVLWAESGLHSVMRLRSEYARMAAMRMTQDFMRSLPDGTADKGDLTLGELKISWQRKMLSTAPQTGYPSGYGGYDARLYQYTYQVRDPEQADQQWFEDSAIVLRGFKARSFKAPF